MNHQQIKCNYFIRRTVTVMKIAAATTTITQTEAPTIAVVTTTPTIQR